MRIRYFDYFRSVAILLIILGHCMFALGADSFMEKTAANLIKGGTALFVFISGFFFHRIFYQEFRFGHFLKNKIKNVLSPYLILSSAGFVLLIIILKKFHRLQINIEESPMIALVYLKVLWTGQIQTGYWYIPFTMLIFAMSPWFIKFINLTFRVQFAIFSLTLVASIFIHRPLHNLSPLHSLLYFIPMYLLGIIYSMNEKSILSFIKDKWVIFGSGMMGISTIQVVIHGTYGNLHKSSIFAYGGIDLMMIQKVFMIFFILSLLKKIEHKDLTFLRYLGSVSFALYFLHPWFLEVFSRFQGGQWSYLAPGILTLGLIFVSTIGGSIVSTVIIKSCLGRMSKFVIGY